LHQADGGGKRTRRRVLRPEVTASEINELIEKGAQAAALLTAQ
jgi:hypothetical protein